MSNPTSLVDRRYRVVTLEQGDQSILPVSELSTVDSEDIPEAHPGARVLYLEQQELRHQGCPRCGVPATAEVDLRVFLLHHDRRQLFDERFHERGAPDQHLVECLRVLTRARRPRREHENDGQQQHRSLEQFPMRVHAWLRSRPQMAIKVLPPDLTHDDTAKQRFLQEAKAASVLDHPNICAIYEINETDDGQLYLVMAGLKSANGKTAMDGRSR